MPKYNDFDLDLQNDLVEITPLSLRTAVSCRGSYDFGKCYTVNFGCMTAANDCGLLSLSFCCQEA